MKKTTILFLFLALTTFLKSQNLSVGDPHAEWWYYNQGSIDDAEIIIHPQGLYLEIGMYLTFSGKGSSYTNNDTIELVCDFDLPTGSIVHDSWLWLNEDTLKADLIDRWTATSIYNTIVGRRQDPSILYKTWDNNYELRIYPMLGDSTRRVKLSYLVPLNYTSNSVFATLPMNIIKLSKSAVENVRIRMDTNSTWRNPRIMEYPDLKFVPDENSVFKTNTSVSFNSNNYGYPFTLEMDSPMKDGVFINHLDEDENYYQLAFLPSYFIKNIKPKNVLFCVDYSSSDNYIAPEVVFENLKHSIAKGLSPIDSFNLMFSSLSIEPIQDKWVSVKDLEDIFTKITENPISNYSNLPTLLYKAIDFVKTNGSHGEICLIANSEGDGEPQAANELINDLLEEIGEDKVPIHCANFARYVNTYYWIGNTYYNGNDYLYVNLSRLTNGNYSKINYWQQSFTQFLFSFTQTLGGLISSFDLHTSLDNGFCYSRFDLNAEGGFVYINKPFLQIGKYYGDLPFNIEVAGLYNGLPFSQNLTIKANDILESDTLLEEIWAGNYIKLLENQRNSYSNEIIREIIDYSMNERVLSIYTAFLAIEPGVADSINIDITVVNDNGWEDGEWPVEVEEQALVEPETLSIKAYPNPFNSETHFELYLPDGNTDLQMNVKIYDVSGKLVFSDCIANPSSTDALEYTWKGNDSHGIAVPRGTYIVQFSSKDFKQTVKVLKM